MSGQPAVPAAVVNETDERFYVAASTIPGAGSGLFARIPLSAGARLEVIGVLVLADSVSDRCTTYADTHKFRVGHRLLIPLGYGGMVNHSLTPNLEKVIEGDHVFLQAMRGVAAGEELFFCYSEYAQERFGLNT
jgi:hypothetical protein